MRVQNVDHNENRELRRDCAAVFQMLLDCQQQHLIAEGIVIARTAGGKENGRGSLFLCGSECTQHLRCLSADGNADCSAALIEQNGIHFHDVNVGNCFNIHACKHKTQLHFLGGKSGASKTVDIHPTLRSENMADAVNLRAVGERVAFIQQLLIRIQHLFDVIVRARQCGVQAFLVTVDKFAVARVAAFFRKAGERSLRNIE